MGWRDTDELSVTLADKLVEYIEERNKNPANGILHHKENIDLLPANLDLSALELSLVNTMSRETVLKSYVNSIKTAYDYVVIDCMEVATVDENKKAILSSIFWDMNNISKSVETRTETITKELTDGQGNTIETTEQVEKKYLVITLTGKSADDMANSYSFNDTQKKYLAELMSDKNNKLWALLIYNIGW